MRQWYSFMGLEVTLEKRGDNFHHCSALSQNLKSGTFTVSVIPQAFGSMCPTFGLQILN
jgi:hypothetical protein